MQSNIPDPLEGNWTNIYSGIEEYDKLSSVTFGNEFLDKATKGIFTDDFILVGAASGVGKTQFCVNIALKNAELGKKVRFIALEASKNEIQKRVLYRTLANIYFSDKDRKYIEHFNYADFYLGEYKHLINQYESEILKQLGKYDEFKIHYGGYNFTINDMIARVHGIQFDADLVIIDHAHYFDLEESRNENLGLKKLAKEIRRLTQELQIPVILVAHLRKKDKFNEELVPGIDEFHGSSDLSKIATKVITIANGEMLTPTRQNTYIRINKNRFDGSVKNYVAQMTYNYKNGDYDDKFLLGSLVKNNSQFNEITKDSEKWPTFMQKNSKSLNNSESNLRR